MKKKTGPVQVFIDRCSLNGMIRCLDYLISESDGEWKTCASRIKEKILKHGRTFENQGMDSAVIYFYETEAAVLIKAFALYVFLRDNPQKDYYAQMKMQKSSCE
jgi:hypothetical protein